MKKTVLMFATAALAALSLSAVAGNKVSAATKADTDATVTLTKDTNPNETTKYTGSGDIELTQAPSFTFDGGAIDGANDKTVDATGDAPLTVVNPGVAATWSVDVEAGTFTSDEGNTLKGATLVLNDGGKDAINAAKNAAVFKPATLATPNTAKDIFASATMDGGFTGVGTNAEDIKASLTVPAGNVAGTYKSALTWTLSTTPQTPAE